MLKRNRVLRSQTKQIILNVHDYMKYEAKYGVQNEKRFRQRVADATLVSVSAVQTIVTEGNDISSGSHSEFRNFHTPDKRRSPRKFIADLDHVEQGVLRRCVHNFHITHKELPTIKMLLLQLEAEMNYKCGPSTLQRILKHQGFKWKKTVGKSILIEKPDIRLKRIEYLDNISKYREEGRTIVYTDESYLHSLHANAKVWPDYSDRGLTKHVPKNRIKLVIAHAATEDGFIPEALLMYSSDSRVGKYRDDMNFDNYLNWITYKLIPNLPPNSVVVVGNAPYHMELYDPAPTCNATKADMEAWLRDKGVPFSPSFLKPQLYKLITLQKEGHAKKYEIDAVFKKNNHTVLRLPPLHLDLNPIKMAWASVKSQVSLKCPEWQVDIIKHFIQERLEATTKDEWNQLCSKVREIEKAYLRSDLAIDELTEDVQIRLEDFEDFNESESNHSDESDYESSSSDDFEPSMNREDYAIKSYECKAKSLRETDVEDNTILLKTEEIDEDDNIPLVKIEDQIFGLFE